MKTIERVQTGLRLEKRIVKVLKATAEYLDISMAELVEAVVLHAFDGKAPFSAETQRKIVQLKEVFGLDLAAADSHQLREPGEEHG